MTTPASVAITAGAGTKIATFEITEGGETREIQRIVLCDAAGNEIGSVISANASSTADSPVEPHQPCAVVSFTPTLDTSTAYSAGDVLFATVAVALARANDRPFALQSLNVIDKSKQHPALTLFFYQTSVTSAAANAANNLSDTDAINCLGYVSVAATDWKDLANNSFACFAGAKSPGLVLAPAAGTTSVYVVGILDTGTPTFALGDLVFKFGVPQA